MKRNINDNIIGKQNLFIFCKDISELGQFDLSKISTPNDIYKVIDLYISKCCITDPQ